MTSETAILAGGCFWGMEELIRNLPGVQATRVGYSGGVIDDPTYEDVKTGTTNHAEAIEVTFNPTQLSYQKLLEFFFQIHDPSTRNRQGNDRGSQYRSVIFYLNDAQQQVAQEIITRINHSGKWPASIVTEVVPARTFYTAEDYHQKYLQHHVGGYTCHFIRPHWTL
ncbi:Peptide methionine sulfoxide reductase MsrA [Gammaproteobacteria bacterium]